MGSRVVLKPSVYWDTCFEAWASELDHITWTDSTHFDTWDKALDHALWLGLCAGVWSQDG